MSELIVKSAVHGESTGNELLTRYVACATQISTNCQWLQNTALITGSKGTVSPILVPCPAYTRILLVNGEVDIFESFRYTDSAVDARIPSANHDNLQRPWIFHWSVVEFEIPCRRIAISCAIWVGALPLVESGHVKWKIRYGGHDVGNRVHKNTGPCSYIAIQARVFDKCVCIVQ